MNSASPSEARLAHLVSLLGDRYEFQTVLGVGGSGTVYEVRHRSLGRREALKVLAEGSHEPEALERFTQEARIAASLDHPGIVRVHDFGMEGGTRWYTMQIMDGPSLAAWIEQNLPIGQRELAGIAMPILEALEFSHARGVVHRDIKPANILFDDQGHPRLADFGIAKSESSLLKTQTGILMGTPAYASPEQALGESVDARSDQYSFGLTLYRAATGRLPFSALNSIQTLVMRINQDPEHLLSHCPEFDPELAGIIMRALSREKEKRWPNTSEMKWAFGRALERLGISPDEPVGPMGLSIKTAFAPIVVPPTTPLNGSGRGSMEATAELNPRRAPVHRSPRRLWLAALALPVLLGATWAWARWGRPAAPEVLPQAPAPVETGGKAPEAREPVLVSPETRKTTVREAAPVEAPIRRPVVYPRLLEEGAGAVPAVASECAGQRVNVSLVVGEDGSVRSCKVLSKVPAACAEGARFIALRYHFSPALDAQGRPVEATVAAAVDFPEVP